MNYSSHGSFEIKRVEDVILVRLIGGTNIELFYKLQKNLILEQEKLECEKWALVTDFTDWDLAPPDFFKAAGEHSEVIDQKRTKPCDHIIIDPTMMMVSIFKSMGLVNKDEITTFHNVRNREAAERLLKNLGYSGSL